MSATLRLVSVPDVTQVLYNLVQPMLASTKCIKCVSHEGGTVFTSDVLHLLCSLDIDHPAGEIVIQALQSHHKLHGSGTKTLLFFMVRIIKAVCQLQQLGISQRKSLTLMQEAVSELLTKVEDIAIPLISEDQPPLVEEPHKITTNVSSCAVPVDAPVCDNESLSHCTDSNCVPEDSVPFAHAAPVPQPCCIDPVTLPLTRDNSAAYMFDVNAETEGENPNGLCVKSDVPETDIVYLKMSSPSSEDSDNSDIDWFFSSVTHKDGEDSTINDKRDQVEMSADSSADFSKNLSEANFSNLITSARDGSLHDSDFEDCFDDTDNRQYVNVVVEPVPPPHLMGARSGSYLTDAHTIANSDTTLFRNARIHYPIAVDFDDVHDKTAVKRQESEESDEFSHCIVDSGIDGESSESNDINLCTSSSLVNICNVSDQDASQESSNCFSRRDNSECVEIQPKQLAPVTSILHLVPSQDANFDSETFETYKNENTSLCSSDSSNESEKNQEECLRNGHSSNVVNVKNEIHSLNAMLASIGVAKRTNMALLSRHYTMSNEKDAGKDFPKTNSETNNAQTLHEKVISCEDNESSLVMLSSSMKATGLSESNPCDSSSPCSSISSSKRVNADVEESCGTEALKEINKIKCVSNFRDGTNAFWKGDEQIVQNSYGRATMNNEGNKLSIQKSCDKEIAGQSHDEGRQSLLEKLLLQKTSASKLSIAMNMAMSSRHFSPGDVVGLTQEDDGGIKTFSDGCTSVLDSTESTLKFGTTFKDCLVDEVNGTFHKFVEEDSESFSQEFLHKSKNEQHSDERSAILSINLTSDYASLKPDPLMKLAVEAFEKQIKHTETESFNVHLIDCIAVSSSSVPSAASLIPGLLVQCEEEILQPLRSDKSLKRAILVNGDLTISHHHKGYKPTLSSKTLIDDRGSCSLDPEEVQWAQRIVNTLKEISVGAVLVRGKISDVVLIECLNTNILPIQHVSHHTLSVLGHAHCVPLLVYVTEASVTDVCSLHIESFSDAVKGTVFQGDPSFEKYAVISNMADVQTVLVQSSCDMSSQLLRERVWQCLHTVDGVVTDARVLPGGGVTEQWCAEWLKTEANRGLNAEDNQCFIRPAVLEALSDVFQDFATSVRLNLTVNGTENLTEQHHDKYESDVRLLPVHQSVPGPGLSDYFSAASPRFELQAHNKKWNGDYGGREPTFQKVFVNNASMSEAELPVKNKALGQSELYDSGDILSSLSAMETKEHTQVKNRNVKCDDHLVYTKFDLLSAKVAAWTQSVDVAHTLLSLHSLVTTGLTPADMNGTDVIL
ncbi:uncharacterized protein LOC101863491 [Aplysia californica]|uniref:Uncharacterized protein LOC101863491 n=1 Tax=Aplysia californica TaxID=6500 RepID=A0ABM0ZUQ4_APLCA|nr:uncharacterized protein LOC101863491 [Aplysia californica]